MEKILFKYSSDNKNYFDEFECKNDVYTILKFFIMCEHIGISQQRFHEIYSILINKEHSLTFEEFKENLKSEEFCLFLYDLMDNHE